MLKGKIKNHKISFRDMSLYNPINMSILEKEGLILADSKAKNKVKRYEIRNQIEKHYHTKGLQYDVKNQNILENKFSYKRYDIVDQRGYNIINLENLNNTQKNNKNLKHNKSEWDRIVDNSKGELKANITADKILNSGNKERNINITYNKGKFCVIIFYF